MKVEIVHWKADGGRDYVTVDAESFDHGIDVAFPHLRGVPRLGDNGPEMFCSVEFEGDLYMADRAAGKEDSDD